MLRALQRLLETIYDAPCGQDVEHFLLTRRAELPAERRAHHEKGGGMGIGLMVEHHHDRQSLGGGMQATDAEAA